MKHGQLRLYSDDDAPPAEFGEHASDGLSATVRVHQARVFRELLFGGSLGGAEAYLRGDWSTDHLTNVLRLMCRNLDNLLALDSGLARIAMSLARGAHWLASNSRQQASRILRPTTI